MARPAQLPRWQSYLLLLTNTIVWGASLIIVKPALDVTSPFRYLLYRFILASFLSIPLIIYYWPKIKHHARALITISTIELLGTTISLGLLYYGLSKSTAIETSLLATTQPLFMVVASVLILKEKEEKHEWAGLVLALVGTLILTLTPYWGVPISNWFNLNSGGTFIMVLYNIVTCLYFILVKKYFHDLPKLFTSAISFFFGMATFLGLSLLELGGNAAQLWQFAQLDFKQPSVWIASGYMAVFGSIIGLTAYVKGQDGIEASEATLFGYLQPFVYIPLAIWLLHEQITTVQIVGLVLILVGVMVAEMRRRQRRRRIPTLATTSKRRTTSRSHS